MPPIKRIPQKKTQSGMSIQNFKNNVKNEVNLIKSLFNGRQIKKVRTRRMK